MPAVGLEIALILLLILANGLFALAELAVMASRKSRLQERAEHGDEGARAALELVENPHDFLSTVQIGITLVGILTGAFSGATLAEVISAWARTVPWLAPYSGGVGVGTVVLVTTFLSLVIGELVPKRIALTGPERIAGMAARPMRLLSRFSAPVVWLLSFSTSVVVRLLGIREREEPLVTEDEVRHLIRQGTVTGVFQPEEQIMLDRVLRLGDRRVGSLLTPRREVVWLDLHDTPEAIRRKIAVSDHSRFPVCDGSPDRVMGAVHATNLLVRCLAGEPFDLAACVSPPLYVPETLRAHRLVELFRESGKHLAVVLDEHGGTLGLVTPTDVLEAIAGELPGEGEETEPLIVEREDGSWLVDGRLRVEELKQRFHLRSLPDENQGTYETVGGMMGTCLGRIPATGDHFPWGDLRFEVVDMDGLRVDKVLINRVETERSGGRGE